MADRKYWAVVNDKTGAICWRDFHLRLYAIYGRRKAAENDCAAGQVVRQVSVRVLPEPQEVRGILTRGDCDD